MTERPTLIAEEDIDVGMAASINRQTGKLQRQRDQISFVTVVEKIRAGDLVEVDLEHGLRPVGR